MSRADVRRGGPGAAVGVTVILPSFNEEAAVATQVQAVRTVLTRHRVTHEIIVVDDGSPDATSERALDAGARLLRPPENRGYGASIKAGTDAAPSGTTVNSD